MESRRRVLGSLDVNAPSPQSKMHAKLGALGEGSSPLKQTAAAAAATLNGRKRPLVLTEAQEQPAKKKSYPGEPGVVSHGQRAQVSGSENDTVRETVSNSVQRSASPDTSSVFDSSGIDASLNTTTLTEPDMEAAAAVSPAPAAATPPQRRLLTREEARQRAEVLKLRLGLASYKVRTGQADVPLERLQRRPLPGRPLPAMASRLGQRPIPRLPPPTTAAAREPVPEGQDAALPPGGGEQQLPHAHASPERNLAPSLSAPQPPKTDQGDGGRVAGAVGGLLSSAGSSGQQ